MMVGDTVNAAINLRSGCANSLGELSPATIRSIDDIKSAFYLNIDAVDQPGVLAEIAGVFGDRGVSIGSMEQEKADDGSARLVFITHSAIERNFRDTLDALEQLDVVKNIGQVLRVISSER